MMRITNKLPARLHGTWSNHKARIEGQVVVSQIGYDQIHLAADPLALYRDMQAACGVRFASIFTLRPHLGKRSRPVCLKCRKIKEGERVGSGTED